MPNTTYKLLLFPILFSIRHSLCIESAMANPTQIKQLQIRVTKPVLRNQASADFTDAWLLDDIEENIAQETDKQL
jgi:hypothetical protein